MTKAVRTELVTKLDDLVEKIDGAADAEPSAEGKAAMGMLADFVEFVGLCLIEIAAPKS